MKADGGQPDGLHASWVLHLHPPPPPTPLTPPLKCTAVFYFINFFSFSARAKCCCNRSDKWLCVKCRAVHFFADAAFCQMFRPVFVGPDFVPTDDSQNHSYQPDFFYFFFYSGVEHCEFNICPFQSRRTNDRDACPTSVLITSRKLGSEICCLTLEPFTKSLQSVKATATCRLESQGTLMFLLIQNSPTRFAPWLKFGLSLAS